MITHHSAQTYSLVMHAKYHMPEFEQIKHHKKTDCHYSVAHSRNFKRVIIDTECSLCARHEVWIDGVYYVITLSSVSYAIGTRRPPSMNVNVGVTVMHDVEYTPYYGSINDDMHFTVKDGAITPAYMVEYALGVFDHHKDGIIQQLHHGVAESRLYRLFEGDGILDYFHP